jgi:hypothetical protein
MGGRAVSNFGFLISDFRFPGAEPEFQSLAAMLCAGADCACANPKSKIQIPKSPTP